MMRTRRLLAGLLLAGAAVSAMAIDPLLKQFEDAFVRLGEEVRPSVVNIDTKAPVRTQAQGAPEGMGQLEDLFRFFNIPSPDRQRQRPRSATGSGFVLDKEGHIVTNNHVVDGAEEITVRLWNRKEYKAEIVGTDPDTDLAVIKIDAPEDELRPVTLGNSDELKVGQFAIAMGSPRGFEGSLSFGHISALGRENLNLPGLRFQNFIQTDAAINPGNSGGPLTNIEGEVIGINVAIVWGAESLGFAIPVNMAKQIVPELISKGRVTRGYLGVEIRDARAFAEALDLPDDEGAFVLRVRPGTPAYEAGLQRYDVIRGIDGETVSTTNDVIRRVSSLPPGTDVTLDVWRDGQRQEIVVKLAEWDGGGETAALETRELLGMSVQALTPEIAERLGIAPDVEGVLLANVEPGSAADDAGLRRGDVVIEVGREKVTSVEEFRRVVSAAEPGSRLLLGFVRGGADADVTVLAVPE